MKKYIIVLMSALLSISCNAQNNNADNTPTDKPEKTTETPKGSWKVDKEFDENGNLIRYDSLYSWSSNHKFDGYSSKEKDSIIKSFESNFFENFSHLENQGFENIFDSDSLFSKHFFNDDFFGSNFGNDFMDIENIRQRMLARQQKFLEKYQSEFIKPED